MFVLVSLISKDYLDAKPALATLSDAIARCEQLGSLLLCVPLDVRDAADVRIPPAAFFFFARVLLCAMERLTGLRSLVITFRRIMPSAAGLDTIFGNCPVTQTAVLRALDKIFVASQHPQKIVIICRCQSEKGPRRVAVPKALEEIMPLTCSAGRLRYIVLGCGEQAN